MTTYSKAVLHGKKSKSGSSGGEDPNTLYNKAKLRFLGLISEGIISGFSDPDPAKQIYINNIALKDSAGNLNYQGVTYTYRPGLPDQDHIAGLTSGSSLVSLGDTEITTSTPYQFVVSAPADSAIVTIALPALADARADKGLKATTLSFKIEVKTSAGSYVPVITRTYSNDKCVSRYEEDFYVPLAAGGAPWTIKITRLTADATLAEAAKLQNKLLAARYQPLLEGKFTYRNRAVIGVEVDAEQFGNNSPSFKVKAKGIKVWVPKNYNPTTRVYSTSGAGTSGGTWDGTFKLEWTDNPAWILFDLMTNNRYGLGDEFWPITSSGQLITGPSDAAINKWALYVISQYCDELVSDGYGGTEPRYTCNVHIKDRQDAFQVLSNIVSVFRGMLYLAGGEIIFTIDKDDPPSFAFNQTDVIDGLFTYSSSSQKVQYSVCAVRWNDPMNFGAQQIEIYEDSALLATIGHRMLEVDAFGCTSRSLARRIAKWRLLTEKLQNETLVFSLGQVGGTVFPGAVIDIYDPYKSGVRAGGKLTSVVAGVSTTKLYVDNYTAFPSGMGAAIAYVNTDGVLQTSTIIGSSSPLSYYEINGVVTNIISDSFFAINWSELTPAKYRVVLVTDQTNDEVEEYQVTAIKHIPTKYAEIESNLVFDTPQTSIVSQLRPEAPDDIDVTTWFTENLGSEANSRLTASWSRVSYSGFAYFELQMQTATDPFALVYSGSETSWTSGVLISTTDTEYTLRVRVVDMFGRVSDWTSTAAFTLEGDVTVPSAPSTLSYRNFGLVSELSWVNPTLSDYRHTEIWNNTTNNSSTATLLTTTAGDFYTYTHATDVVAYFWFKTVTNSLVNNTSAFSSALTVAPVNLANAVTASLTNSSHNVPANSSGVVSSFSGANTTMSVYLGEVDDSTNWTYSVSKTNLTCTEATSSRTQTVTAMSADVGYLDITASKAGYASRTLRFTVTKVIAGASSGADPTTGNDTNTNGGASSTGTWQDLAVVTMTCSAGYADLSLSDSFPSTVSGGGDSCSGEYRVILDGSTISSLAAQQFSVGASVVALDHPFGEMITDLTNVPITSGTRVFKIQVKRTAGTDSIAAFETTLNVRTFYT